MHPFEAIFQPRTGQGLYASIRLGAFYAVRNDPRNGISALPQETYHDCYTSRV